MRTGAVITAAGMSSRMGDFKPMLSIGGLSIAERVVATLQQRFPKLKIVAAHLGGFGMWDEAEASLVGTSVSLDLSHTFFWMPDAQILRMVKAHGAERILFGTDAPWQDQGEVLEAFLKLPLSEQERRAICHTNASTLFHLP